MGFSHCEPTVPLHEQELHNTAVCRVAAVNQRQSILKPTRADKFAHVLHKPRQMNCLHPSISQRLTPLVIGISAERRRAVLNIAQQAASWQDFLDALKQGDFPLPRDN